jgi:hypothetical protein
MFLAHTPQAVKACHALWHPLPAFPERVVRRAQSLYRVAAVKRLGRRMAELLGRRAALPPDLDNLEAAGMIRRRFYGGCYTVPLTRIGGTVRPQRCFDGSFHPLNRATRGRWLAVAALMTQGEIMAPVSLDQVGDRYFVRDGCCRVSVAHALGHRTILADVTTCQVVGTLPWQRRALWPSGAWA